MSFLRDFQDEVEQSAMFINLQKCTKHIINLQNSFVHGIHFPEILQ